MQKIFMAKVGDVVVVNSKDLYEDPMNLENTLGLTAEEIATFDKDLEVLSRNHSYGSFRNQSRVVR